MRKNIPYLQRIDNGESETALKNYYQHILLLISVLHLCITSTTAQDVFYSDDRYMDSVMRTANSLPDGNDRLKALEYIGLKHNNVDTVEKYANIELELAQKLDSQRLVISANMVIGWCYYVRYNYNAANTFYFRAMHVSDSIGDKHGLAICYHSIANSMAMMTQYIEADNYDQKALKLFIELKDSANISYIHRSLGQTCIDFGMYKAAKKHFSNALKIDLKRRNQANIANDYLYIGSAERSEYDDTRINNLIVRAKEHTLMAYNLLKSTNEQLDLLMSCQDMMSIMLKYAKTQSGHKRKELIDSSKIFYNEGINLAKKNGLLEDSHDFRIIEIQYAIEEKDYAKAGKMLKEVENKLQQDSAFMFFFIDLYDVFVEYYKAIGNYKKAYDYQCKAIKLRNENFNFSYAIKSNRSAVQNEFDQLRHERKLKDEEAKVKLKMQVSKQRIFGMVVIGVLLFALIFIILTRHNMKRKRRLGRILELHNHEIELQRDQLAKINQQITSDIIYAQKIQNSMMPTIQQITDILGETLIIWKPLNIVSGDFYWATQCGTKKLVTIVDCTGHGVPGAFMSMFGMSTLCDITNMPMFRSGMMSAADILELMRSKVVEALRQTEQNNMALDGMDMALCIIEEKTMEMQFAGAFRPLVVIRNGEVIRIKADKMPVGYLSETPKAFRNNTMTLYKDDCVYMFSDGISDQFGSNGNGKETKFSTRRLINILAENYAKPMSAQKVVIEKAIIKWRTPSTQKQYPQTDDILMIGFRI
jgi:serine phosphatase RsbU (regulator of sigma subunit)/tetratricopeptide (TPR) repeat protein